jgi:Ca2+-transporting ATPase
MPTWLHKVNQSHGWRTIKGAWARWTEEDGDQRAAAFAYYLLLSLLPLIFILLSASSLFVEREVATREVVQWIERYVPLTGEQASDAMANIRGVLEKRGKISLAALPLLLWGGLKFLRTLIRTTNRIWHSPAYKWWRLPLKSLGLLGVTLSAALLGILLPGIARLARSWLATYLEFPGWAFALLFNILPWFVLFCGVIMIYRLAPSRPTKFSEVWIGALVATGLIWACEWLFLLFTVHFAHFNMLYGALGGAAALLLWIYLSSCIGVFGICLCAAQAEVRGGGNLTNHSGDAPHE